eukprot:TRINITY_DN2763_c0_g1_i2.p1 TRINITY_DN2763_c0_g1~~TRINITY_DN2763_c0_g1_i2.p1  ORF type:complete len:209 (-),score=31.58 TRINITY_DN2763_c0_g1_i2:1235-1861(-)
MATKCCDGLYCKLASLGAVGLLLLVVLGLSANTLATFSPIYTPMECNITEKIFGQERMGADGVRVNGTGVTVCRNPNRLNIEMQPIEDTKIFLVLGDNLSLAGVSTGSPHVFLAGGSTEMPSATSMHIDHTQLRGIMHHHMTYGEPMMMSVERVWARVEVDLYGLKLRSPWLEQAAEAGRRGPADRRCGRGPLRVEGGEASAVLCGCR